MKLFVLHYHLRTGGVSRIIDSQIKALQDRSERFEPTILSATEPEDMETGGARLLRCEDLQYLDRNVGPETCRALHGRLHRFLRTHIGIDDVVHVHNPNLGKNPVLTLVLSELAAEGYRLVLHCHDFAEDRPANLDFLRRIIGGVFGAELESTMYPRQHNVLFAALNARDMDRFEQAGIPAVRTRLLPNPVHLPPECPGMDPAICRTNVCSAFQLDPRKTMFLYPVRAIRRKNIGEVILIAVLLANKASCLITRAPRNPLEQPAYLAWKEFARQVGAPVSFEAGHRMDFTSLLRAADRVLTTSVQEGFGMMFLEPWLYETPVLGRNIPYVTADFLNNGLRLDNLYEQLPVVHDGRQDDFANLPDEAQRQIIQGLREDESKRQDVLACTGIDRLLLGDIPADTIQSNKHIIQQKYSLSSYGQRLVDIYRALSRTA